MSETIDGFLLEDEIRNRGYAEFDHHIPGDAIDGLVEDYADLTLTHPDPLPSTIDAMLPSAPSAEDLENSKFQSGGHESHFVTGKWMAKKLDELDRSADKQAEWHKYRTNTPQIGKPDGYSNRSYQQCILRQTRGIILDPVEDSKEFYHFTPGHYAEMARIHRELGWGPIPPEVARLNTSFASIHTKAVELMIRICSLIEETHPEINNIVTPASLRTSPVRLLFYHPSDNTQLAAPHYDKGLGTLQLAESHEGLRVAPDKERPLEQVIRSADRAVYFSAHGFEETIQDTPFQPAWHDVLSIDRLNDGREIPPKAIEVCGRYAIIFFTNKIGFKDPDKDLMHNR